jgi:hypothetical protein
LRSRRNTDYYSVLLGSSAANTKIYNLGAEERGLFNESIQCDALTTNTTEVVTDLQVG